MKNLLFLSLMILIIAGCTKDPIEEPQKPSDVKFSIDYKLLTETGNMVAKSSPHYSAFYTKYIAGRLLTPRLYQLIFTNTETGLWTSFIGRWGSSFISLPAGTYKVEGESMAKQYYHADDTCFLSFDDNITILQNTTSIVLPAKYSCTLFLIDNNNVSKVDLVPHGSSYNPPENEAYKRTLMKTENFYHTFILTSTLMDWSKYGPWFSLSTTKTDNSIININLGGSSYRWDEGKYYYFLPTSQNTIINNFTIDEMVSN